MMVEKTKVNEKLEKINEILNILREKNILQSSINGYINIKYSYKFVEYLWDIKKDFEKFLYNIIFNILDIQATKKDLRDIANKILNNEIIKKIDEENFIEDCYEEEIYEYIVKGIFVENSEYEIFGILTEEYCEEIFDEDNCNKSYFFYRDFDGFIFDKENSKIFQLKLSEGDWIEIIEYIPMKDSEEITLKDLI